MILKCRRLMFLGLVPMLWHGSWAVAALKGPVWIRSSGVFVVFTVGDVCEKNHC
jgi:hypothetical protein